MRPNSIRRSKITTREVTETNEEMGSAMVDGVADSDDLEEIEDEREDDLEAAGEVVEQRGDLIEEKTD